MRKSLGTFCTEALAPFGHKPAAHHRLIISKLEAVERGEIRRLMIFMPPGAAKSTYASVLFPAWYFAQGPHRSIIGTSHTADLANAFSRKVQFTVREHGPKLGYGLASESAELWHTTNDGQYRAAGVGGPIAGFRADLGVIDDPTKSRMMAESATVRDTVWAWYGSDFRTRLKPDAAVVAIGTRYHEDDLFGRLLNEQGPLWDVLKLPAVAEDDDPLGRAPGEFLWADDSYGYAALLHAMREETGPRDWWSLYQQAPRPSDGGIFKIRQIATLDAEPAGTATVRAWDLAGTRDTGTRDADWTVGTLLGRTREGSYTILDVVRFRGGPEEVEATIIATASRDGRRVPISIPQDPGQAGKAQIQYLTRRLAGYRVHSSTETGDKSTRAMPFASQVNVGNVSLLRAAWNREVLDEMAAFPSGSHDDVVDSLSRAFAYLSDSSVVDRFRALA